MYNIPKLYQDDNPPTHRILNNIYIVQ